MEAGDQVVAEEVVSDDEEVSLSISNFTRVIITENKSYNLFFIHNLIIFCSFRSHCFKT